MAILALPRWKRSPTRSSVEFQRAAALAAEASADCRGHCVHTLDLDTAPQTARARESPPPGANTDVDRAVPHLLEGFLLEEDVDLEDPTARSDFTKALLRLLRENLLPAATAQNVQPRKAEATGNRTPRAEHLGALFLDCRSGGEDGFET
eukprot:CAMPEP_0204197508 /NCGR_PEP_ID=MMETSP0361-20130328/64617_1 /ASSEMBLY_ACC=CAM_ASM_000343 /TAXON_ID=268821 /ORGANISM="Scrippsiella Hangoei, Strain SHTV-5" /LENGTH=149 /DNA_ID=CAMNT_0051159449 /DNA_START=108 /DNA_END=556 /DNA_ORIENTATION=+